MNNRLRQLSKFLSYALGRKPDEFGLVLDTEGFIPVRNLIKAISEEKDWAFVRMSHIQEILLQESHPSFEIAGKRIRSVDRKHVPQFSLLSNPPKLLYVCVRQKSYLHVLEKGILPSVHPQVILSSDKDMAIRIGRRRDAKPVLLTVLTRKCIEQGVNFFQAGETLFTAGGIPFQCFTGPAPSLEKEAAKYQTDEASTQKPRTSGSFFLEIKDEKPSYQKNRGRKKEIPWKKGRKRTGIKSRALLNFLT